MKRKVSLVVICCFFLNLILAQSLVYVRPVSSAVAVKTGDWIKYYKFFDKVDQYWVIVKVLNVNDTSLEVNIVRVYIPDNEVEENITIVSDADDVLWYKCYPLIIPKNFDLKNLNDAIDKLAFLSLFNLTFTFQMGETIREYNKVTREILFLNGTYERQEFDFIMLHNYEYIWDKASGFLLEIVDTVTSVYTKDGEEILGKPVTYFLFQVSETSLWPSSTPTLLDTTAKVTLIMAFPAALACITWRKNRRKRE